MDTYLLAAIAVNSFFAVYVLFKILFSVAKTAKIAEEEKIARAEHRKNTVDDRQRERRDKKINAAGRVIRALQDLLADEGISLVVLTTEVEPDAAGVKLQVSLKKRAQKAEVSFTVFPDFPDAVAFQGENSLEFFFFPEKKEFLLAKLRNFVR